MKVVLLVILAGFALGALADDPLLDEANDLIGAGKPDAALQALLPVAAAQDADPLYHYLVGIAALDSGDLDAAIAALKRALDHDPMLLQAHAELGRAYALRGEPLQAWLAFSKVRDAEVPPEVQTGIERFIDTVAGRLNPRRSYFGSVSAGLGYDSNVNSGTTVNDIALPLFGLTASVSPDSKRRNDTFTVLAGDLTLDHPLTESFNAIGNVVASGKYNHDGDLDQFALETISAYGGLRRDFSFGQLHATGVFEDLHYLDQRLRREYGFDVGWRPLIAVPGLDLPLDLDFRFAHTELDFVEDPERDASRDVLSVDVRPSFFGRRIQYAPPLLTVYVGDEDTDRGSAKRLGYFLTGVRATWFQRVLSATTLFINGGYEYREYDAPDALFASTRSDDLFNFGGGVIHDFGRGISVNMSARWIQNESNQPVYEFKRGLVSANLRKSF